MRSASHRVLAKPSSGELRSLVLVCLNPLWPIRTQSMNYRVS